MARPPVQSFVQALNVCNMQLWGFNTTRHAACLGGTKGPCIPCHLMACDVETLAACRLQSLVGIPRTVCRFHIQGIKHQAGCVLHVCWALPVSLGCQGTLLCLQTVQAVVLAGPAVVAVGTARTAAAHAVGAVAPSTDTRCGGQARAGLLLRCCCCVCRWLQRCEGDGWLEGQAEPLQERAHALLCCNADAPELVELALQFAGMVVQTCSRC
jgi:hypothetical protein